MFQATLPTRGSTTPRKWDFKEIGTLIIDVMLHRAADHKQTDISQVYLLRA